MKKNTYNNILENKKKLQNEEEHLEPALPHHPGHHRPQVEPLHRLLEGEVAHVDEHPLPVHVALVGQVGDSSSKHQVVRHLPDVAHYAGGLGVDNLPVGPTGFLGQLDKVGEEEMVAKKMNHWRVQLTW